MSDVKILTPWSRDPRSHDPSVRVRLVEVDGRRFELRNLSGPGWFLHVRPMDNRHLVRDMADWDDWPGVAAAARRCVEAEGRRAAKRRSRDGCGEGKAKFGGVEESA